MNELKDLLYTGNAPTSSSVNDDLGEMIVDELRNYSRETHRERIIRGIVMCLL